jgi:hypothetical protein
MGWTSTGDPYANLGDHTLVFDTKEAAIDFVQRHGWQFTVNTMYWLFYLHFLQKLLRNSLSHFY